MASIEESIDSNEFSHLQALMLQHSPTANSQNIGSKLRSPTKKHNQSSVQSQPDGQIKPRSLPNTSAVRKAVDAAPDMTTTIMETPSQQKTSKNHDRSVSFLGFPMDLDGDTQPMPSQIFRDQMRSEMIGLDGNMITREQNTLQEGEAGHINLLGDFEDTQAFANGHDAQSLDGSPVGEDDTQNLLSSMQRQSYMKTPATIGQKRDRQGNVISPSTVSKTPGLSGFFGPGQGKPVMTATQLFNMTQADSSPMVDFARSDPIESRPSPNFVHDTSPAFRPESSPTKSAVPRPSAPSEPRDHYEPMDKSQERHWQKIRDAQRSKTSSRVVFDFDEDSVGDLRMRSDPSPGPRLAAYKQTFPGPPRSTLDALKERSPLNGLPKTPYTTTMDEAKLSFQSSGSKQRRGEVVEISDDASEDGSVDAYDELNGDIIPSQRQAPDDADMEGIEEDEDVVDGDTRTDEVGQDAEAEPQQIPMSPERRTLNDIHKTRGSAPPPGTSSAFLAVADSQPGKPSSQPPMRGIEPSSISSFVPGSQIGPLSSQTRARIADELSQTKSSSLPQPPGMVQLRLPLETQTQTQTQVPSSPPLPESSHRVIDEEEVEDDGGEQANDEDDQGQGYVHEEGASTSAEIQLRLSGPQPEEMIHNQEATIDSAALQPSSNKVVMGPPNSSSGRESNEKDKNQQQSEMTAPSLFETAHTHLSASQASRKSASAISESPRKAAGIRRFGDIALDPTPPDSTKDLDISIPMDFMTEDDHAFLKAVQSPPKRAKKALTYGKRANRVVPTKVLHPEPEPESVVEAQTVEPPPSATAQPEQESSPIRPATKRRKIGEARNAVTFAEEIDAEEPDVTRPAAANTVDETNPKDVNQEPAAVETTSADTANQINTNLTSKLTVELEITEDQEVENPPEEMAEDAMDIDERDTTPSPKTRPVQTPESVERRNKAGMMAAAAARRALFSAKGVKKGKGRGKRTKVTMPKSTRRTSAAKGGATRQEGDQEAAETDSVNNEDDQTSTILRPTIAEQGHENVDADETVMDITDTQSRLASDGEVNPASKNRVLAFFKGSPTGYYPATCTGVSGPFDDPLFNIRFDDGSTVVLKQRDVCAFDLREGDLVKLDDQRLKSKTTFIVDGFGPEKDFRKGEQYPLTDIYGQITVAVRERTTSTEKSLPTPSPSRHESIRVPMANVYVVSSQWTKMQDRKFMFTRTSVAERSSTPSTTTSIQVTPKSRSRRRESLLGGPHGKALPSMKPLGDNGIFRDMAFALSYGKEDDQRIRITKLIFQHGGQTLQSGFHELFEASDLPESMPSSPGSRAASSRDGDECPLRLTTDAQSLGFVALIAHSYSRSEKYVQALALSLPILHGRWISDSLAAGKPLPWTKYLLPAGESMYLSGAVRSRTLTASPPDGTKLSTTVANRERLLQGGGVLLVVNGKGKDKEKEKARIYAFLSLALGASQVRLVSSALEAKERVERDEGRWKWVHCDDKSTVAVRRVFAGNGPSKKKTRVEGDAEDGREGEFGLSLGLEKVRIVGDEFVLQSLILGTLIEE
ncbi:hypothetical protein MBLNU457_g0891t1 [Dothideomycetes sp. NU457]